MSEQLQMKPGIFITRDGHLLISTTIGKKDSPWGMIGKFADTTNDHPLDIIEEIEAPNGIFFK